jgi:23S rRNA maturation mini-RNase III
MQKVLALQMVADADENIRPSERQRSSQSMSAHGIAAMLSQIEKSLERDNATNLKRHRAAAARRIRASS